MLRQLENGTLVKSVTLTPSAIEARDDLGYAYGLFTCISERQPRQAPIPHGVAQAA